MNDITPQLGPQTVFNRCRADIAIYGGAAGGGKTFGLLLDPVRHLPNSKFGGTIFRRTSVQIKNEGGLWDESRNMYPFLGAIPREYLLDWQFPSGMSVGFSNLEHEKDVYNYQGAQIPWIGFDELTHFSENQFFYMLSRNRSASAGVKPRIRATCNPDPDSFVKRLILWWLDDDGAYARPERSGVIRWFIRINDEIVWADSPQDLYNKFGNSADIQPKSFTFIPSKLSDNQILMNRDPAYRGNLLAMNRVDRMRLLEGNWNVRAAAGMMFQREWFPVVDQIPGGWVQIIRFWDRAATRPSETNKSPDWTRGLLLYKYPNGTYCVGDLKSMQDTPLQVENLIKNTAAQDSYAVKIMSHQDPGSAGVAEAHHFVRMLSGYDVHTETVSKDKITRAKPVSAQSEAGNISVLRAPWNNAFFTELENFPEGAHDDIVDVFSGAFNGVSGGLSIADIL